MSTQKKPNQTALKRLSKALLTYAGFVALAMVVWIGHALSSVRNANVCVRVQYVGVPEYIGWKDSLPEQITLQLRDAGRRLGYYHQEGPVVTIDLSDQITRERGEIRVSPEMLRRHVGDLLLGTTKLQNIEPAEFRARYYTQKQSHTNDVMTEKKMKVRLTTRGVPKGETLRIFPGEVSVSMMVGMSHWGEITEEDIVAYCHYPKGDEDVLKVEVEKKSRWIGEVRTTPERVEYIIEK